VTQNQQTVHIEVLVKSGQAVESGSGHIEAEQQKILQFEVFADTRQTVECNNEHSVTKPIDCTM